MITPNVIFFLLISLMLVFVIVSFCIFGIIERAKAEEISSTVISSTVLDNSGKTTVLADLVSESQRMPEPEYQSTRECYW